MMKRWDVAVAGEIFADHVFSGFARWPGPGEELCTENYVREPGGGTAITACALARLGRKAAIFAVAGREDVWLRDRMRRCGVDLAPLRLTDEATAVTVSLSTKEDRSFFTWPGANRGLAAYLREEQTIDAMTQARHVHFAVPLERSLAQLLLPRLKQAGCTLSIDPGYHPEWFAHPQNRQTCAECDFFLPNLKEGELLTGHVEDEAVLTALAESGMQTTVLKLGARGAAVLLKRGMHRVKSLPVACVDTTGAGDAFDAGFLDAMLDGAAIPEAIQRACVCGSLSTRSPGAIAGLPLREEFDTAYEQFMRE
jgi:sugar/nucleoside kinase (ribokinase family)